MKKFVLFAAVAVFGVMVACKGDKKAEDNADNVRENLTQSELQDALATQDSLFALINEITDGMYQIKQIEKIASSPSLNQETPTQKEQIKADMVAISQKLRERREKLAQLEAKLTESGIKNDNLVKTIETLKRQLADQQTEIETLTNQLAQANIKIDNLNREVSSLNNTVDTLNTNLASEKRERQSAELQAENAQNELNTVYYAIGSGDELKAHNITSKKFLGKTKVLKGDFDASYFTRADRRSLRTIALHSKKNPKILTDQPQGSYEIVTDNNGNKVLRILNPDNFWRTTSYLVIQL